MGDAAGIARNRDKGLRRDPPHRGEGASPSARIGWAGLGPSRGSILRIFFPGLKPIRDDPWEGEVHCATKTRSRVVDADRRVA